jgi:2-polyprenyl-3-methyl-5-hydroxy-6-metoxy-1,4-benzoquinol methylase
VKLELLNECNICSNQRLNIIDKDHNLCQCENCKFVFSNPRPVLSEIVEFYSKSSQYGDWLCEIDSREILWKRRLDKLIKTTNSGTLIDIGAGIGQFLKYANSYFSKCFGTEVSDVAITIAKERYNIELLRGSIEEIDFQNQRFDNISMFHVLEHVHNPKAVLELCHNLLNNDGAVIIAVPNEIDCWKSKLGYIKKIKYLIRRKFRANTRIEQNTFSIGKWGIPKIVLDGSLSEIHLSYFTPQTLKLLLEECSFKIVDISLDPFYVKNSFINNFGYLFHKKVFEIFGINMYDTIWVIAKKSNTIKSQEAIE